MIQKEKLLSLPKNPGCYLFLNKNKEIIYVGKAKNIRKRVISYFQKKDHDAKTDVLVSHINDVDFIVTKNEIEALLLENNLIKKHYPMYNIDLKDSRRYAYLRLVTTESLPFLEVARTRDLPGEYYGPFVSGKLRKYLHELLRREFKILIKKASPALKRSIDPTEYSERVEKVRKILKGRVEEMIKSLNKEMKTHAKNNNFEYALTLRNQIDSLEILKEKQHTELTKSIDAHVINYVVNNGKVFLLVFGIRKGVLEGKQEFSFPYREFFLDEFIKRYYSIYPVPKEVIVPNKIDPSISVYLSRIKNNKVNIIVPSIGDKKALLDLVLQNVNAVFFPSQDGLIDLKENLNLKKVPLYIECFDISHLHGSDTVASMVAFLNGQPEKSRYRKFKIRSQTEGDDFLAMKEVIKRRYSGMLKDQLPLPDLIVIDGGIGQLGAGMTVLKELKLNIPVISLAKKLEEIYLPNKKKPLKLGKKNKGLQILQAARDEAHRFAISYNRKLRRKRIYS